MLSIIHFLELPELRLLPVPATAVCWGVAGNMVAAWFVTIQAAGLCM